MSKLRAVLLLIWVQAGVAFAANINPPQAIFSSLYKEYDLAISPGGRYLVFCGETGGDENIYTLDLDTRKKRQVTFHTASDYSPCFMGDSKILFVSRRANSLGDIYITDLKGEKKEMVVGGTGYFDNPVSAYDEKKFAYIQEKVKSGQLWLGLFSDEPIPELPNVEPDPLEVVASRMAARMAYAPGERDMVVLLHYFAARFEHRNVEEHTVSTLIDHGDPDGDSAMSRTVPSGSSAREQTASTF